MKRGFTLLEVMFVVAILACLSMISVPHMMRVLAKSKRAEAYLYLRSLAQAQKLYYAEHGTYAAHIDGAQGLGWKPEGQVLYTYGTATSYVEGSLKTPGSVLSCGAVLKHTFILAAAGYIYKGKPDIITIDDRGHIELVSDALTN